MNTPKELIESRPKILNPSAMQDLLEKTRLVGRALQNRKERSTPDYHKLARLLCDLSAANVYLINQEGKILGYSWISEYDFFIMADLARLRGHAETLRREGGSSNAFTGALSYSYDNHDDLGHY
jgi:hypothetical protein